MVSSRLLGLTVQLPCFFYSSARIARAIIIPNRSYSPSYLPLLFPKRKHRGTASSRSADRQEASGVRLAPGFCADPATAVAAATSVCSPLESSPERASRAPDRDTGHRGRTARGIETDGRTKPWRDGRRGAPCSARREGQGRKLNLSNEGAPAPVIWTKIRADGRPTLSTRPTVSRFIPSDRG